MFWFEPTGGTLLGLSLEGYSLRAYVSEPTSGWGAGVGPTRRVQYANRGHFGYGTPAQHASKPVGGYSQKMNVR